MIRDAEWVQGLTLRARTGPEHFSPSNVPSVTLRATEPFSAPSAKLFRRCEKVWHMRRRAMEVEPAIEASRLPESPSEALNDLLVRVRRLGKL